MIVSKSRVHNTTCLHKCSNLLPAKPGRNYSPVISSRVPLLEEQPTTRAPTTPTIGSPRLLESVFSQVRLVRLLSLLKQMSCYGRRTPRGSCKLILLWCRIPTYGQRSRKKDDLLISKVTRNIRRWSMRNCSPLVNKNVCRVEIGNSLTSVAYLLRAPRYNPVWFCALQDTWRNARSVHRPRKRTFVLGKGCTSQTKRFESRFV